MSDFLTEWFQWFEKGINCLNREEKEKFFCKCGRSCADTGVVKLYEKLYMDSGENLDMFFSRLNEIESVAGDVVTPGRIYEISFPRCLCDLHTFGYVYSGFICECSRQSIIYVMKSLEPEFEFQVDKMSTVLDGDRECRFRITVI